MAYDDFDRKIKKDKTNNSIIIPVFIFENIGELRFLMLVYVIIDRTSKCGNVPYIEAIRKWLSIRNVCAYAIWFFIAKPAFNYALLLMGASNLNIRQTYYDIIA